MKSALDMARDHVGALLERRPGRCRAPMLKRNLAPLTCAAPAVLVSLSASSAQDVPRGMEFLYSRNRLNVAVSRAKALCIMVGSPTLLAVPCRTVDQMRLANVLCRYVEMAERSN